VLYSFSKYFKPIAFFAVGKCRYLAKFDSDLELLTLQMRMPSENDTKNECLSY